MSTSEPILAVCARVSLARRRESAYGPRRRCGRCRCGSRAPVCRRCSSSASLCRPPCMPRQRWAPRTPRERAHFTISLASMIRFISLTTSGPTHTALARQPHTRTRTRAGAWGRTLFADEAVIAVVRVVRIAKASLRVLKLEELVPVLARMPGASAPVSDGTRSGTRDVLVSGMRRAMKRRGRRSIARDGT
jgi:hypothetical protein